MNRLHSLLRLLLFAALVPAGALAQGAPVIDITGARFRPVPLAAPAPQATDEGGRAAAREFDAALMLDLNALGIFEVLDRKGFLADPKEGLSGASIKFNRWADVGAEALVKTALSQGAGGALRAELRLFNVGAGKEELALSEDGPADAPRRLAHRLADALYTHYTREPGPFANSRIAFGRKTPGGRDVWMADWDGAHAVRVTRGGLHVLPSLVPGGEAVAFTSYAAGNPDIVVQRPGGKATALVRRGAMATGVDFSPDGKRIAYSLAEGEGAQLWVANADGSAPRRITDTPSMINSSPSWSPDGKRLAFVSNRFGSPQVFVMNADGTGVQRLTYQGNYNQTPAWSPRGDLIAFTARDERNAFDLFVVEVATRKITRLTQDQGNNEEPAFSPNGRLILFTSTRADGSKRLYVMTADGSRQIPLPLEKGTYLTPSWGRFAGR